MLLWAFAGMLTRLLVSVEQETAAGTFAERQKPHLAFARLVTTAGLGAELMVKEH